ncbi:MAG: hypothetical protein OEZ22_11750 [Spirochaetia bacterium]|nr:hypothetical protein [Spirochaetia bacterium]
MKKFKFKLEPFLKLKKLEEKNKMVELSKVAQEAENQQIEINNYYEKSGILLSEEAIKMREGIFDLSYQIIMQNYFYNMKKRKEIAERKMLEIEMRLKKKQDEMIIARKNRRVIEIIKEKKWENYCYETGREEIQLLDEQYNRKKVRLS